MTVLVTENIALLAGAPQGISRLRALILELAIRGKLVPQDPEDEHPSEVFSRMDLSKATMFSKGELARFDSLASSPVASAPFAIPPNWEWRRLGALGLIGSSSRVHQKDWTSAGVPFYRTREIVQLAKTGSVEPDLFISEELYDELTQRGPGPAPGDIMLTGVGTIGVPYVVQPADRFYFKDASVLIFKNCFDLSPEYLSLVFSSPYWKETIHKESMGTTVHTLTISRANEVLIPVAPAGEQARIVAKVDELMSLCDRLEAEQADAEAAHAKLVEALLASLTQARDAADFRASWQQLSEHFHSLLTTEASIDALKHVVLQLAVQGKLVPQNRGEVTATEFLKSRGIDADVHVLPGWATVSLGNFGAVLGGATPSKANAALWSGDIPWVSPKDMKRALIADAEDHVSPAAVAGSALKLVPPGSILMVVRGMILAHSFPVALTQAAVTINQDMKALVPPPEIARYLLLCLQAAKAEIVSLVDRSSHGTCKLVSDKLWAQSIAVPPLAEQERIVVKVDELLGLCDQLKLSLAAARNKHEHIASALVEQAAA